MELQTQHGHPAGPRLYGAAHVNRFPTGEFEEARAARCVKLDSIQAAFDLRIAYHKSPAFSMTERE